MVDAGKVNDSQVEKALNAMGYEEAAQHVYGMTYGQWKKQHQKKATDEQMKLYNTSKPLHAVHDKGLLETRAEKPVTNAEKTASERSMEQSGQFNDALLSNVCCQDVEEVAKGTKAPICAPSTKDARSVPPFQPPPIPPMKGSLKVGILTVSDRASTNQYETGDLSGPAVAKAVENVTKDFEPAFAIVPDDLEAIQSKLSAWCKAGVDMILTTGGTGMSPRDVTPEATRASLDQECAGLMSFVTNECSRQQPLASLSRGTAGICGRTVIANLPGNPKGVGEVVPVLLPLLMHALFDLQSEA